MGYTTNTYNITITTINSLNNLDSVPPNLTLLCPLSNTEQRAHALYRLQTTTEQTTLTADETNRGQLTESGPLLRATTADCLHTPMVRLR